MFLTNACLFILRDCGDVSYFLVYVTGMHTKISKLLLSQNDSSVRMVISQPKPKVLNGLSVKDYMCEGLFMYESKHGPKKTFEEIFQKNFLLHTHFFFYCFFSSPFIYSPHSLFHLHPSHPPGPQQSPYGCPCP